MPFNIVNSETFIKKKSTCYVPTCCCFLSPGLINDPKVIRYGISNKCSVNVFMWPLWSVGLRQTVAVFITVHIVVHKAKHLNVTDIIIINKRIWVSLKAHFAGWNNICIKNDDQIKHSQSSFLTSSDGVSWGWILRHIYFISWNLFKAHKCFISRRYTIEWSCSNLNIYK